MGACGRSRHVYLWGAGGRARQSGASSVNASRPRNSLPVAPVSDSELADFERRVGDALASGDESGIEILGYGEVSTVLALHSEGGRRACKRLAALPSAAAASVYANTIRSYMDALEARGVRVLDTEVRIVDSDDGGCAVYCIQPAIDADAFGPNYVRGRDEAGALEVFEAILDLLTRAVDDTLAPDGQLSNWAFIDGAAYYTDISSPFMRAEDGRDLLDWGHLLRALPAVLRPAVRRWVIPRLLDKYFTLRGQVVDLLGNLQKERLQSLIPAWLQRANSRLALSPPVTAAEVSAYYRDDARTYALLLWARRADRWWQRKVRGRCYPYFLPPPIERNL